jgi:hypothetical protein
MDRIIQVVHVTGYFKYAAWITPVVNLFSEGIMPRISWEIKKLWIPAPVENVSKEKNIHWWISAWGDEAKKGWARAEELSSEGWELVSMVAETAGHEYWWDGFQKSFGCGSSSTNGYFLIFKRPKE